MDYCFGLAKLSLDQKQQFIALKKVTLERVCEFTLERVNLSLQLKSKHNLILLQVIKLKTFTRVPSGYSLAGSFKQKHKFFLNERIFYVFHSLCDWQLRGWYEKDDVVAEWKRVKNEMCLHVHCFVSGPNPFLDLAAEFRYHIFSKEMPLVCLHLIYIIIPLKHPINTEII